MIISLWQELVKTSSPHSSECKYHYSHIYVEDYVIDVMSGSYFGI